MGLESVLDQVPASLAAEYRRRRHEIRQFQAEGHRLREEVRQNPVRHGHLLTREMHPTELAVCKALCRDLSVSNGKERTKAWYWVLRQPWGEELRASPYEQRYFWNEPARSA
jgi:hypothetical protein